MRRKMTKTTQRILRAAGLVAVLAVRALAALGGNHGPGASARAKARHYFALASRAGAEGHFDRAYEYAAKAHRADPSYVEGAWQHAN